ncbi:translation elongation factor EF-Ts [Erysipelotrichaceae bacterium]|nr:translation elongation factor EF-Ts [Erysipelotrichaceae bacterium]
MKITGQMVKELREIAGAGILDCKHALTATNGNIKEAVEWLTENGVLKAAKKNDRVAAEGLCGIRHNATHAVIYEVNAETDFVAKNDKFLDLINLVGDILLIKKPADVEAALKLDIDGQTLEQIIAHQISVIGEKITLRRFEILEKSATNNFGIYVHMGGRIAALTLVENATADVAKDVAMHVAAINPLAISRDNLDAEVVAAKKAELTAIVVEEGKPQNIAEKIVEGRMGKFFAESVLLEQDFVKNPDMKVAGFLEISTATVQAFVRYAVGEGIEKEEVDFATEVMSQVRQ